MFSFGDESSSFMAQLISGGDTIMYYSTLYVLSTGNLSKNALLTNVRTLILHAIPAAQQATYSAVEAAREALQAVPDLSQYNSKNNDFWGLYCHW